jgi:hypothetical protein
MSNLQFVRAMFQLRAQCAIGRKSGLSADGVAEAHKINDESLALFLPQLNEVHGLAGGDLHLLGDQQRAGDCISKTAYHFPSERACGLWEGAVPLERSRPAGKVNAICEKSF